MNDIPKIIEIIKIEPYKVTCRWSTGEIRVIDFEKKIKEWKLSPGDNAYPLLNYENFKYATIGEGNTLCWPNIQIKHINFSKGEITSPLAFCPENLYHDSQPINNFRLVKIRKSEKIYASK
ncbi:MAG: hypothetical protein HY738_03240 [Bacteroidia bacterium]|nr:hypothetical protein [Bacteroidia bacterium]